MLALETLNRSLRQFGVELYRAESASARYGITSAPTLRNTLLRSLARLGYAVRRTYDHDVPPSLVQIAERVRPFTMTSPRSVIGLCEAVQYLVRSRVDGAFVECGVWRGGSVMAAALTLLDLEAADRDLYLFDTFAGMAEPTAEDVSLTDPQHQPLARWQGSRQADHNSWLFVPLEEVRGNLVGTGYPSTQLHLIKGRIEDTIPAMAPERIALLRLDTDWHSSTAHELEHLYPRLVPGGILIIDDYGAWAGARQAVDEYAPVGELFFARLEPFGRIAVKRR